MFPIHFQLQRQFILKSQLAVKASVPALPEPEPILLPEPKKATDSQLTISTEETPHPTEVIFKHL